MVTGRTNEHDVDLERRLEMQEERDRHVRASRERIVQALGLIRSAVWKIEGMASTMQSEHDLQRTLRFLRSAEGLGPLRDYLDDEVFREAKGGP